MSLARAVGRRAAEAEVGEIAERGLVGTRGSWAQAMVSHCVARKVR